MEPKIMSRLRATAHTIAHPDGMGAIIRSTTRQLAASDPSKAAYFLPGLQFIFQHDNFVNRSG